MGCVVGSRHRCAEITQYCERELLYLKALPMPS